jgi:hypothetical protein
MMQAATSIQKAHSLMRGMKMKTLTIASSVITKEIMNPKPIAVSPGHNHATKEAPDARWTPGPPPESGGMGSDRSGWQDNVYPQMLARTSYQKEVCGPTEAGSFLHIIFECHAFRIVLIEPSLRCFLAAGWQVTCHLMR